MCGASLSVLANTLQTLAGHSVRSHVLQRLTHTLTSSGSWIKCIIPLEQDYRLSTEISNLQQSVFYLTNPSTQPSNSYTQLKHTSPQPNLSISHIFLKYEAMFEVFNHSFLLIGKVKQNITTVMKR